MKQKTRVKISVQIIHMGGRDPSTGPIPCCLQGCTFTGSEPGLKFRHSEVECKNPTRYLNSCVRCQSLKQLLGPTESVTCVSDLPHPFCSFSYLGPEHSDHLWGPCHRGAGSLEPCSSRAVSCSLCGHRSHHLEAAPEPAESRLYGMCEEA